MSFFWKILSPERISTNAYLRQTCHASITFTITSQSKMSCPLSMHESPTFLSGGSTNCQYSPWSNQWCQSHPWSQYRCSPTFNQYLVLGITTRLDLSILVIPKTYIHTQTNAYTIISNIIFPFWLKVWVVYILFSMYLTLFVLLSGDYWKRFWILES